MASWFSIKILSLRSPFDFDTEKEYNGKSICVQGGNSNWGKAFVEPFGAPQRKVKIKI